ncbi:hypothetical protein V8D89_007317 [Ganoderma adspersum]
MTSITPQNISGSFLAPESMDDVVELSTRYAKSGATEYKSPSAMDRRQQPIGRYEEQRGVALLEPTRVVEDLPHLPYDTTRQGTLSSAPQTIYFQIPRLDGSRFPAVDVPYGAVPLLRALDNDLNTLVNGDRPAPLYDASTKLSIRLLFGGCEPYARQIMARRSTPSSEPISVKVLAHKIALEMKECLTKTCNAGKPLTHRGRVVELEDLYLWRLVKVSSGSWIPEFKVMT